MLAQPKPVRRYKVPRPLKRATYLGARRAAAKAAGTLTPEEWQRICAWSRFACSYCLKKHPQIQQEHRVPITRGGKHEASNICLGCPPCNARKGTQTWDPHPSLPPHPFRKVRR